MSKHIEKDRRHLYPFLGSSHMASPIGPAHTTAQDPDPYPERSLTQEQIDEAVEIMCQNYLRAGNSK